MTTNEGATLSSMVIKFFIVLFLLSGCAQLPPNYNCGKPGFNSSTCEKGE